jgi:starch synthase
VEAAGLRQSLAEPLDIPLGGEKVRVGLRFRQWRSVSVCFIDHPPYFDRDGIYGSEGKDHPDNDRRFALFSRGVLEGAKAVGFKPDVIHAHDWQTGLVPAYLARFGRDDPFYAQTASVFTIHNMAYQGNFPRESLAVAGFPAEDFTPDRLEYYGRVSYLKAGLLYADLLTTVSPTYAREIQQSSDRGFGFEGLLRRRAGDLHGVLNGLDLEYWNPEKDPHLGLPYSAKDWRAGKAAAKKALRAECALGRKGGLPLAAVVSRLDFQKGLDLAVQALEPRHERCDVVVLGTGDPAIEELLSGYSRRRQESVSFHAGFDEAFAHRLYAAADLLVMPSRFEPCGLGQMIAMRYGALPVASRTGGLADTVFEDGAAGKPANGFLCEPGHAADRGRTLASASKTCGEPSWGPRVEAAMGCDFSWDRSMAAYLGLYSRAQRARAVRA